MSTIFIAVQCFQCSTMQVKQRKKSSNKWNCVVCNEKQSVRKVFSQGFMAKDVRKFVQSFNMSRQFVEQQQELREETLAHQQVEIQPNRKRTDWSEYIDPDINDFGIDDDERELCEPNIVTELPKPLFKKPKLRKNYSAAELDFEDGEKLRKPVFQNRNLSKKFNNAGRETLKEDFRRVGENQFNHDTVDHCSVYGRSDSRMTNMARPNLKRNACEDGDCGSSSVMVKLKRPVSKWNDFIDKDAADGSHLESRCEEFSHSAFETKVSDEIVVEDDVHPDFM